MDSAGNLFIADTGNQVIRKVSLDGTISTVATGLDTAEGVAVEASGAFYITDYSISTDDCDGITYSGRLLKISPDGTASIVLGGVSEQPLNQPQGIAADKLGNVNVADSTTGSLLKVSPAGVVSSASTFGGVINKWPPIAPAVCTSPMGAARYAEFPRGARIVETRAPA